jgi:hypothetical protein
MSGMMFKGNYHTGLRASYAYDSRSLTRHFIYARKR